MYHSLHKNCSKKFLSRKNFIFENYLFPCYIVRRREYRRVPCSRALLGGFPPGYICQRCHAEGILNRRADEVQERVQIQNRLRGIADGDGAVARLREWRMGPYESHQTFRSHTNNPSGIAR